MQHAMWTGGLSIGWVTQIQEFFNTYQQYFCFQYRQHSGKSKIFPNISFTFFRSSTKIIKFDNAKFPKSILYKVRVWRKFLDKKSTFSKKWILQKSDFLKSFFSVNKYNYLFFTKKILLFSIFCRSRRRTSTVMLEGIQLQGRKKGSLPLSSKYLDGVFALNDLLVLGKKQLKNYFN